MPEPIDPNKRPEQHARGVIDAVLGEAGWVIEAKRVGVTLTGIVGYPGRVP